MNQNLKILILTNDENSYSTNELKKEVEIAGHEPVVLNPADLFPYISENIGRDRLYHRKKESDKAERLYQKTFDACISRVSGSVYGHYILRQIANMGIFVSVTAEAAAICSDKFTCSQTISKAKINVPRQILSVDSKDHAEMLQMIDKKFPIFCKLLKGSQGKGVLTLDNAIQADMVLGSFAATGTPLVLQRYINRESEKKRWDVRCICIGAETDSPTLISYKRKSATSDPRANYSISKTGEKFELDTPTREMVIKACKAVGIGVAGVDLLFDEKEKRWYVLEINSNPGLQGVTTVTGVNVAQKIVQYTIEQCHRPAGNKPFFDGWAATQFDFSPQPTAKTNFSTINQKIKQMITTKKTAHPPQKSTAQPPIRNEQELMLALEDIRRRIVALELDQDPRNQLAYNLDRVATGNIEAETDASEFEKKLAADPRNKIVEDMERVARGEFQKD